MSDLHFAVVKYLKPKSLLYQIKDIKLWKNY